MSTQMTETGALPWMIHTPLQRESVQEMFELHADGESNNSIATIVGHTHGAVERMLSDKIFWDPYVDWVVVERALAGDVDIYYEMTYFEWVEVRDIWRERRPWDFIHTAEPLATWPLEAYRKLPPEIKEAITRIERRHLKRALALVHG
jgi:hypothetical protein